MHLQPQQPMADEAAEMAEVATLRQAVLGKAAALRVEAFRLQHQDAEEAAALHRIADRLTVYMRDYLDR